ncbi:MAG: tripartite tricarboxylate transporter substrate binding protein [Xanthobacteraceae bacterium]|nr:tripartite tricarboxylate transporter substrate binding protein [Xanthobacteraceae bacterium]
MTAINRRALLLGAALSPLAIGSRAAAQANWPNQVIRIVVPFAPGSFTDVSARLVAQELTEQLGQSVIVENRGGAGGNAGTLAVVRAAPDGYTLLLTDTSLSIAPGLYAANLPYDPIKDLAQISRIADSPSILLVRPGLGPKTLAELVDLARQKPGEITFGSGGQGSSAHLAMEFLLNVAGIKALHVPFRGVAAAIADVIAGRIDMAIASLASGVAHVKAGTLLGLGVSGDKRSELLPEVPTFAEAGQPRYNMSYWWGIAAPAGTPRPVVERLHREIVKACGQPRLREAFLKSAALAVTSTPEDMTKFVTEEIGVWRNVIKSANVTAQ